MCPVLSFVVEEPRSVEGQAFQIKIIGCGQKIDLNIKI